MRRNSVTPLASPEPTKKPRINSFEEHVASASAALPNCLPPEVPTQLPGQVRDPFPFSQPGWGGRRAPVGSGGLRPGLRVRVGEGDNTPTPPHPQGSWPPGVLPRRPRLRTRASFLRSCFPRGRVEEMAKCLCPTHIPECFFSQTKWKTKA